MASTPLFEAASSSRTSSDVPLAMARHELHDPHGSPASGRVQLRALARARAAEVFPRSEERRVGQSVDLGGTGVQTCALPISLAMARHELHDPHGSPASGRVQLRALARARAAEVFPVPRGPLNR